MWFFLETQPGSNCFDMDDKTPLVRKFALRLSIYIEKTYNEKRDICYGYLEVKQFFNARHMFLVLSSNLQFERLERIWHALIHNLNTNCSPQYNNRVCIYFMENLIWNFYNFFIIVYRIIKRICLCLIYSKIRCSCYIYIYEYKFVECYFFKNTQIVHTYFELELVKSISKQKKKSDFLSINKYTL